MVKRGTDSTELNEILKTIMNVVEKHYDVDVTSPPVYKYEVCVLHARVFVQIYFSTTIAKFDRFFDLGKKWGVVGLAVAALALIGVKLGVKYLYRK